MARIANDLTLYERYADQWWNEESSVFKTLQAISVHRLQLIDEWFGDVVGKSIVDLGCGGGLLSVPLIERGAEVIGVDISPASIKTAAAKANGRGKFIVADVRNVPLPDNSADYVIVADVLDHIADYSRVVSEAARILKPAGLMYINLLNRNFLSYFLAIVVGEGIGLVPKGTHAYNLFIRPTELLQVAEHYNLRMLKRVGDMPEIFSTIRDWKVYFRPSKSLLLAYSVCFQKAG